MKYIIFAEFNRNHFLFLSYFIIVIIKEVINELYGSTKDIIASFVKYYSYSISDILSIIPIIIITIRSKSVQKDTLINKRANTDIILLYADTMKNKLKRIKKIFKYETIISLFDFLGKYSNVIFNIILAKTNYTIKKMELNAILVFNIFSMCILSYIILHSPFYRHHYFSLIINLIFLILLVIYDQIMIFKEEDWNANFLYIANTLTGIFYSFENLYGKILLSFSSISPYALIFYRGITVSIITILSSIILIYYDVPDENGDNSCIFTRYWKLFGDEINIIFIVGIALTNFIFNIHIYFIIDKFSPTHYAMATILDIFGSLLINGSLKLSNFIT